MLGKPNISIIMYCEISAPQFPIQFVAMASGLLIIFWSSAPVNKCETKERIIKEDNYFHKDLSNEYLQSTATINEGCSGGGLFNLKGELIGINTWKLLDSSKHIEGMNFSISIDIVKNTFKDYLD